MNGCNNDTNIIGHLPSYGFNSFKELTVLLDARGVVVEIYSGWSARSERALLELTRRGAG